MRRSIVLFTALLGLLVTACAPAGAPAPTVTHTPLPSSGNQQPETYGETTPPAGEPATNAPAPTTLVATPDIDKVLYPQPDDHKLGSDGAPVTIIEWSDFQ